MDLRPLFRRDFRLLYAAQAVSFLGTMVTYVALPWQMYTLTRSTFLVGLLGVVELVPLLLTAFVGGALADWMDRRRLVIATEIGLMAGCLTLMANAARPSPSVAVLFVSAALMSALSGLQKPSLEAMAPRLVPPEEIPAMAALTAFRGSVGMIAGPAIGGLLISSVGLSATYAIDVVSYMVALACLVAMAPVPSPEGLDRPSLSATREGLRYASSRQELVGTYVVDFLAMVFGMPLALFPAISDRFGGPSVLGWLYAAPAAGALAASLGGRLASRVKRQGVGVMAAATAWGLAIVAFGLCDTLWPALVWLAVAGCADAVSGIFRITMWHGSIPDALRGRLAAIEMISYMSGPLLGHAEAGAVAALAGVQASIVSGGVLCVIGVIACGLALPRFRRYDARTSVPTPPC